METCSWAFTCFPSSISSATFMLTTPYLCCWDLQECVQNAKRSWTSSPVSTDRISDFKPPTPKENKAKKICLATGVSLGDLTGVLHWLFPLPLSCSKPFELFFYQCEFIFKVKFKLTLRERLAWVAIVSPPSSSCSWLTVLWRQAAILNEKEWV